MEDRDLIKKMKRNLRKGRGTRGGGGENMKAEIL
jgi:hypothetical protein